MKTNKRGASNSMYRINDNILMDRVYDPKIYLEGKECYSNKKVSDVKTNAKQDYFEGIVKEDKDYKVKVEFNNKGSIKTSDCNCMNFRKYVGDCKHIIALLHFINEFEEKKLLEEAKEKDLKEMISYYEESEDFEKRYLNIEYELYLVPGEKDKNAEEVYLSLRIGEKRLYSLRDPRLLFHHMESGEELNFGKEFTFNPNFHRFKDEDEEIINLIRIIYENHFKPEKRNIRGYFQGKRVYLTPVTLKSFLRLLNYRDIKLATKKEKAKKVKIVQEDISFNMDISESGKGLLVGLTTKEDMMLLTPDAKYIYMKDKIYEISKEQRNDILPLYKEIIAKGKGELLVGEKYKEDFISTVVPSVENSLNLKIDKKVEDVIYREELKTEIYFDRLEESILGKVEFNYGSIKINPFSSKSKKARDGNKILIRDKDMESQVLAILELGDFKVLDGGIYLDDDEEIFNLVSRIIPLLQYYGDVYYSESFSDIRIRNLSEFSGGVEINKSLDLLEFDFNIDGINISELSNVYESIKRNKKFYRLKDGSFLPLDNEKINNIMEIVDDLGIDLKDDRIQAPKYMSMYLDKYLKEKNLGFIEQNEDLKKLIRDVKNSKEIEYKLPKELEGVLRDYQKTGFKWLKTMDRYGFGGILADDMGLGKTLQVIAFLLSEKEEKGRSPSLIIVPTSLVFNWDEEITKFAPSLKTLLVHGSKEERRKLIKTIKDYDVVITSYPLIRNDVKYYKEFDYRYCILDEAQHIKNKDSLNAKSVKTIKAKNYFALTGTPMENSVMELWSIFDFLMPGYLLSNKKFMDKYEKPIFRDEDMERLKDLNNHIRPFILRRLKKDVLKELPEKIEQKMLVEMTREQKKVYVSYIKALKKELEEEINNKGFNRSHIKILTALTRLRQICCDPSLFIEGYSGGSGKVDSFKELIEDAILGGHRILVFSQFTSMLDKLKLILEEKNIDHMYLNGSTPMVERGSMVREFNDGYGDIFLISLKAGGSGLNLTGADTVIHFDPWWNPAVEDQATDRAYRIGQENIVQVIKLITKGTIEEKIFKLQERKKEMIDMVIQEGETLISKLSEEEILSLFEI